MHDNGYSNTNYIKSVYETVYLSIQVKEFFYVAKSKDYDVER